MQREQTGLYLVSSKVGYYLLAGKPQSIKALAERRNDSKMFCMAAEDELQKFWEFNSIEIKEPIDDC